MAFAFTSCEKDADDDSVVHEGYRLKTELNYEKKDHKDYRRFFLRSELRDARHHNELIDDYVFYSIYYSESPDGPWERIYTQSDTNTLYYTFDAEHRAEPYKVYFYVLATYWNADIESRTLVGEVPTHR